jgi:hypothetical protein
MRRNDSASSSRLELVSNQPWIDDSTRPTAMDTIELASIDLSSNRELISPLNFSHEALYFPLGFPMRLLSNSPAIHAAAEQSWRCFQQAFAHVPLEMRLDLKENVVGRSEVPLAPVHSVKGRFLVNTANADNFMIVDLEKGRAIGCVTEATVASPIYLRYFMLEAAALSMVSTLRAVALHAACVRLGDHGILLCGDSGAGKSSLAYAGARAGWAFVCDDASYLPFERDDRMVIGNCHQVRFRPSARDLFPEVAGFPITPRAAGKPSIEVPTSEWPGLSTANSAIVEQIVFLNRSLGARQELVSLRPEDIRGWFSQQFLSTNKSRPVQEAALSRLLKAQVFELRYQQMAWAIDRIEQLATLGR